MSDLIKREDAIKAVVNCKRLHFLDIVQVTSAIKDLPSADRPQGEWIDQHENGHGFWIGTCNQCGKEKRVDNFCSNCGCRMRKENE